MSCEEEFCWRAAAEVVAGRRGGCRGAACRRMTSCRRKRKRVAAGDASLTTVAGETKSRDCCRTRGDLNNFMKLFHLNLQ